MFTVRAYHPTRTSLWMDVDFLTLPEAQQYADAIRPGYAKPTNVFILRDATFEEYAEARRREPSSDRNRRRRSNHSTDAPVYQVEADL